MMPLPRPPLVPAPQEWSLSVHFSPVETLTRLVEAQVAMSRAAAELAVALSPLGLAGSVGRRFAAPKAAATGSVIPMVRRVTAAVPATGAPKPVPPKPRPVRQTAKKAARPPAVAAKLTAGPPAPAPAPIRPAEAAAPTPQRPAAEESPAETAAAFAPVARTKAPRATRAKTPAAPIGVPPAAEGPVPAPAATPMKAPRTKSAPKPAQAGTQPADPARPRARRAPAKPSQPFKVEE